MNEHLEIRRALRGDIAHIASLVENATQARIQPDETEVMDWLFSRGLWVAYQEGTLVGVIAWQAENLVSVTDVFYILPDGPYTEAGTRLLETIETEAKTLMCETNVVLLPGGLSEVVLPILQRLGYEARPFTELHSIWREVLSEFTDGGSELMVKTLRDRMVMRPL
ncbi:MAG: hypothetical protein PVF77_01900 [Anaerolineae bacterium]|jgi:hypothetical protein